MHAPIHITAGIGTTSALAAFCVQNQPIFQVGACLVSIVAGLVSLTLVVIKHMNGKNAA